MSAIVDEMSKERRCSFKLPSDSSECFVPDNPEFLIAARTAVELYNKQQNSYIVFKRLVKASISGVICNITFEATDCDVYVRNTYEAEVHKSIASGWELKFFRLAPHSRRVVLAGGIIPFRGPMDDPALLTAARTAVELHNKQQNLNIELVRVVKARTLVVAGLIWDITFEATDAGVKNTYQAEIYQGFANRWELQFFRLAPQSPSNLVVKQEGDPDALGGAALQ